MNLFEMVKGSVTTLEAAQRYGLHVSYNGMCTCPFHSDKHPSMRVDNRAAHTYLPLLIISQGE